MPKATARPALLERLTAGGFVPVVASVSASTAGVLFNVNADTLAGNLAARLKARAAGGRRRHRRGARRRRRHACRWSMRRRRSAMVKAGTASAGMIAKLAACRAAARAGVRDVRIVDGRTPAGLLAALKGEASGPWTRVQ